MKNMFIRFPINESELREVDEFYDKKLIWLLSERQYSKDFLRQLVESRSEEQRVLFEMELLCRLSHIESKMQDGYMNVFIVPFNNDAMNQNVIKYIKYCRIYNKKLVDNLDTFVKFAEFERIHHTQDRSIEDILEEGGFVININYP